MRSIPVTLSIIIPAYNEERHLSSCLDSIKAQTEMPDEVIVVDNNSSDLTVKLAKGYKFVTVVTEKKQGVVYARNAGFNATKCDIIGRIDADTILPSDWVARMRVFYSDPLHKNTAFTGGGHFYNVPLPNVSSWVLDQIAFRINRFLLGHYILYGANMAIPRSVWNKIKDDVCLRSDIHEDLDLAIHAHRAGVPITYQAGVQVGVKMRRVFQNQNELWGNMMMWPQTLRVHGIKRWVLGWIGGFLLFILTPLLYTAKVVQKLHRTIYTER